MKKFNTKEDLIAYVAEKAIATQMEDADMTGANECKVKEIEYQAAEKRCRFWDVYSRPAGASGMGGYVIEGYGYTVVA